LQKSLQPVVSEFARNRGEKSRKKFHRNRKKINRELNSFFWGKQRREKSEKMDLSIPEGLTIIPTIVPTPISNKPNSNGEKGPGESNGMSQTIETSRYPTRRVLRPRTERSYAEIESPDINLNNNGTDKTAANGGEYDSEDDDDDDTPMPLVEIKELSAAEIWERERKLRQLREELRNEETKLILLKKIKHSQQVMKENKTPANLSSHGAQNLSQSYNNPLAMLPTSLSKGSLTVIPTNLAAEYKNNSRQSLHSDQAQCFPLPRGQSLPGGATLTTGTSSRAPFIQGKTVMEGRSSSNLSITPSVTITPTTGPVMNLKKVSVSLSHKLESLLNTSPPGCRQSE
jgi:hypothetical protein